MNNSPGERRSRLGLLPGHRAPRQNLKDLSLWDAPIQRRVIRVRNWGSGYYAARSNHC